MEQKFKTILKCTRDNRIYEFQCENDSSLGEVFDVLCELRNGIIERINSAKDKKEQPEEELKDGD